MKGSQLGFFEDKITDALKYKIERSAKRLVTFEPPEGYHNADSGGKDSDAVDFMLKYAGVKFDSHYAITTVDPPELTKYIKTERPYVERVKPPINMWDLIVEKRMPPTRKVRYCCDVLKEEGGQGRVVTTGVRWEESVKRSKREPEVFDVFGSEAKTAKRERERDFTDLMTTIKQGE